ncbi:MAG: DMT family protein [Microscillaceae bacterium]|nr:DMT family protein [Microscillaceae bacterium]
MKTILLLALSNTFMTFAWYWYLKFEHLALWKVILISWGIALLEYSLMVPANRIGYTIFTGFQLKIIQEIVSISVFVVFALVYLREKPNWNYVLSFCFILLAVYFAFRKG